MADEDKDKVRVRVLNRLSAHSYEQFEKESRAGLSMIPQTDIAAGFAAGVEHCLRLLRRGYVTASEAQ